jgi:hypothetical protein
VVSLDGSKNVLLSPVRLWTALLIAAAVIVILWLAIWLTIGRGDRRDVTRWSKGGDLQETKAFMDAVHHPQRDRGQWQSGARDTEPGHTDSASDYTLPHVSVYSIPTVHPAPAHPTLRDLGDLAQVRAIDAIEHASGPQSRPWDDLRKTLSDADEPGERDPFLFERVLVATVATGVNWPPGDRMVWTRIFVKPINFKFGAYTVAATENQTVKVSSVEATNVRKLSADVGLAIPGLESSKVDLSPSSESTVKTSSDVSTQYERLGVDIMPSFLRIIRESGAGGDVIGNTTVSLSLTTDPELILAGSQGGNQPEPEINLVVTGLHLEDDGKDPTIEVLPLVPLPHCALRARVSAVYEQRHIQSGREFYDESRQRVVFIHDVDDERTVDIIGADDVSPFVWTIQLVPIGSKPDNQWTNRRALNARFSGGGSWRQLVFSDYGRAASLAHWVRTHAGVHPSGYEFNYSAGIGLALVKHATDDCLGPAPRPQPEPNDRAGAEAGH